MLPSAPCSRPPHAPVRPMLPSAPAAFASAAPGYLSPEARFRPILPSASGLPWMFIGRSRVRRRRHGASELFGTRRCVNALPECVAAPSRRLIIMASAAELRARRVIRTRLRTNRPAGDHHDLRGDVLCDLRGSHRHMILTRRCSCRCRNRRYRHPQWAPCWLPKSERLSLGLQKGDTWRHLSFWFV